MTGIASVNLSGGRIDSPPLGRTEGEDYPVITARSSIFSNLDLTLSELLNNLIQTSASLNALLNDENRANVSRAIANITGLTDKFVDQSRQLDTIIENLATTLENTRTASVGFPELILQTTLPEVAAMVSELRLASENLRRMSEALAEDPSILLYGRPELKPGPGEQVKPSRQSQ